MEMAEQDPGKKDVEVKRDLLWPVLITVALIVVVIVNAFFIYIAVSGADDVDPAYVEGQR